jgi:hypothetical protein
MDKINTFIGLSLVTAMNLYGGFDFGGSDGGCDGGSGDFQQQIAYWNNDPEKTVTVGTIPKDLKDVYISLKSDEDVDIRLYDANGKKIVHWPNGILNGDGKGTTNYNGVTIEYSGYNGDGTGLGHEYIKITGTTQNDFIMKAFGYKAGYAKVDYSWAGKANCSDSSTPSASGSGDFEQQIVQEDIVKVGDIPPKVNNLYITLKSDEDVDIQLYDKDDGTKIIVWPDGILNDYNKQTTDYKGMQIEWSGYNGDGTNLGHEYIKITGETTCNLTMKAYGYKAGYAKVHYEWGDGTTPPTTKLKGIKFVSATPKSGKAYALVDESITFKATTYSSENGKVKLFIQFHDGNNYGTEHEMHKSSSSLWFFNRELHSAGKDKKYKITAKDLDGKVIKDAKGSIEVKEKISEIATTAYNNAVSQLNKKSGYINGKYYYWVDSKYTYCARLVRAVFYKSGKYSSAIAMYYHYKNLNLVNKNGTPSKGDVIFYDKHYTNWNYGHIGIADGQGNIISVYSKSKGVLLKTINHFSATYLGFVKADNFNNNY